jgi:type VI secretion system protein
MKAGLFDVLVGHFSDETSVEAATPAERRVRSVVSHLGYLFNTRRGSLPHLPEYGLPDVAEVYRDMPDSVEPLRLALKEVVERYEPRLKRVRVESAKSDPHAMRLIFVVSGQTIGGDDLRLQTTFSSSDPAEIEPATAD